MEWRKIRQNATTLSGDKISDITPEDISEAFGISVVEVSRQFSVATENRAINIQELDNLMKLMKDDYEAHCKRTIEEYITENCILGET